MFYKTAKKVYPPLLFKTFAQLYVCTAKLLLHSHVRPYTENARSILLLTAMYMYPYPMDHSNNVIDCPEGIGFVTS